MDREPSKVGAPAWNISECLDLCLKEIEVVQDNIARYDGNGLQIKNWCLTTSAALTAYAVKNHDPWVSIVSVAVVVAFGCTEAIYRKNQYRFIMRSRAIEAFLAGETAVPYRFSVHRAATMIDPKGEWRFVWSLPQFTFFYAALIAGLMLVAWRIFVTAGPYPAFPTRFAA
jgi:hypothetical protein